MSQPMTAATFQATYGRSLDDVLYAEGWSFLRDSLPDAMVAAAHEAARTEAAAQAARQAAEYQAALVAGVPLFRGMEDDIRAYRAAQARALKEGA